jgi:hypothetical protein
MEIMWKNNMCKGNIQLYCVWISYILFPRKKMRVITFWATLVFNLIISQNTVVCVLGFEFFLIGIWFERIIYYHPKHAHILDSGHVFTCRLYKATIFSHERWLMKFCGRLYNIAFLKTVFVMLTAFRTWNVSSVGLSLCFFFRPGHENSFAYCVFGP